MTQLGADAWVAKLQRAVVTLPQQPFLCHLESAKCRCLGSQVTKGCCSKVLLVADFHPPCTSLAERGVRYGVFIYVECYSVLLCAVVTLCLTCRRELSTWWFHLHRALSVVGLILAIAGVATGGNLAADVYHEGSGSSAHKWLDSCSCCHSGDHVQHCFAPRRGLLAI